jgi:YidC/Oxa1 family membrane protein insertase
MPGWTSPTQLPPDAVWTQQPRSGDGDIVYVWDGPYTRVEKRFTPVPNTYEMRLVVTLENKTDAPLHHFFEIQLYGWQDPNVKAGSFFSPRVNMTTAACHANGKLHKGALEELTKRDKSNRPVTITQSGDVRWIALTEQYFLEAIALPKFAEQVACTLSASDDGTMSAVVGVGDRTVQPHAKTQYEMTVYMGPKMLAQLDAVKVAGQSAHLGDVMDYPIWGTTEWLARPMLAVLKAIHFVLPNWGVAIIVLTILIKALTWYPTQSSMKSMKSMAKLKPEMDKLKERFGDDKNALNLAMMELYKKHGVNPLGGCLPILIQMPVYIALYSMLGNSVELYRSPFVGWIRDLTAADPYYVLPLLTGLLMFIQQKTQPTPPDPQQKIMMYAMPVMFTVFSIFLASGLTLYILTNTILTFLQQMWMNRHDKPARPKAAVTTPAKPAKPARA